MNAVLECPSCLIEYRVDPMDPPGKCQVCRIVYCPKCRDDFMTRDENIFDRFRKHTEPVVVWTRIGTASIRDPKSGQILAERPITGAVEIEVQDQIICDRCGPSISDVPHPIPLPELQKVAVLTIEEFFDRLLRPLAMYRLSRTRELRPDPDRIKLFTLDREYNVYNEPPSIWKRKVKKFPSRATPHPGYAEALRHEIVTEEGDDLAHEALAVWYEYFRTRDQLHPALRRQMFSPRQAWYCVLEAWRRLYTRHREEPEPDIDPNQEPVMNRGCRYEPESMVIALHSKDPEIREFARALLEEENRRCRGDRDASVHRMPVRGATR
jgi:hypothetical protein